VIHQTNKAQFRIPMSGHPELHRELMWYATEDHAVIGVIILHLVDHDYSWVVLTESDQLGFMAIDLGTSHLTEEDATAALHDAMRQVQG
jgi:hypothetical protein